MSAAERTARAAWERRTDRWRDDVARTDAREESRRGTRARMQELAARIRVPSYSGRELDVAELDRMWLSLSTWSGS